MFARLTPVMQQPPSTEPVYVISVAARLAGLPCWVLRVLDQEEIVVPARTDSNRRLYSDEDIQILSRVRHWTEERGVNSAGVKVILEMEREHRRSGAESSDNATAETKNEALPMSLVRAESNGATGPLALAARIPSKPVDSTK